MHTTLIVVDPSEAVPADLQVISFDQYLADYPKLEEPRTRVINLCDTEHYLSRGYYCSLLAESALVLVQEYVYTDFDWRIGVLDGRAIYACQYFMARDHWQIYNHASSRRAGQSGGFKTFPTFEVPKEVLDAALKASAIIGRGLYGVDLKQKGDRVYVIEVNDNPSIEHGVEDGYLGDDLYRMIMEVFINRLERRGRE